METASLWETNNEYWLWKPVLDTQSIGCGVVPDASTPLSFVILWLYFGPEMPTGGAGQLPTLWRQREHSRDAVFH